MQALGSSGSWSTPIRDDGFPVYGLRTEFYRELPGKSGQHFTSALGTHTITYIELGNRFLPPRRNINESENIYSPIL